MAKTYIPDQTNSQYSISGDYGDYVLAANTSMNPTNLHAIVIADDAYGNRITINGSITDRGIYDAGTHTNFIVGSTGTIHSDHSGIGLHGDDGTVMNAGKITALYGINISGDGVRVTNNGTIDAADAGVTSSGNGTIVNKAAGIIHGDDWGISLGDNGGQNIVTNAGTISSGDMAIRGSSGIDQISNTGTIDGDVKLSDGNDVFRNKGGSVTGVVEGQFGDDSYYIDRSSIQLNEGINGGWDKIYSSASLTVNGEFEEVFLTGKANAKLVGNDSGTFLTGNAGNNRIVGELGGDKITGGGGNDLLVGDDNKVAAGEGGPDIFIFKRNSGHDAITDFHNDEDSIKLTDYKGLDDYADLKGHIKQVGDNVVVELLDGDQITLRDTQRSDINGADFLF